MTANKPEVDEHLKNLERITSEAVADAYRLRRLWQFSASMISANSSKIRPRGKDEERLMELAKEADHGMAWAGITDGWIDRRMGITKNRSEHGVRAKPNVLAYHVHGGHLYAPDDVVFEDDEDYEPLIRLADYQRLQAETERLQAEFEKMRQKGDDVLEKSQRDLLEAVDSMRGTCGVRYGNTPLDEDIYTHDKWAEDFLQERAEAARDAIDAAMEPRK